jgi:hypothetical protein
MNFQGRPIFQTFRCGYIGVPILCLSTIHHCFNAMLGAQTYIDLNKSTNTGWHRVKESAKKEMMQSVAKQICSYLFAFWFTWMLSLIHVVYRMVNFHIIYNMLIVANVVYRLRGCVFAVVYFSIERMSRLKTSNILVSKTSNVEGQLTVEAIRNSAQRRSTDLGSEELEGDGENSEENGNARFSFNIFDGTVDESSPKVSYEDESDPW